MRYITLILFVYAYTGSILADGGVKRGRTVFEACSACHGERGEGDEGFGAPRLTGQHGWYLVTQLENFRTGIRGTHEDDDNGQVMQPMVEQLSDQDIEDVVAYIRTIQR